MKKRDRNKRGKEERQSGQSMPPKAAGMCVSEGIPFEVSGRCILCGVHTHNPGMFFPEDQVRYGAVPGKTRSFIFAICKACVAKGEESVTQVKEHFTAHMQKAFSFPVWSQNRETGAWNRTIYSRGPQPGMN